MDRRMDKETEERIWGNVIDKNFVQNPDILKYGTVCNEATNPTPNQFIEPEGGIDNCGNTCFLNSTIHALLPIITEAVQNTKFQKRTQRLNLISKILQHKKDVRGKVKIFFEKTNKDKGTKYGQQGAADLFARDVIIGIETEGLCFLTSLHTYLKRSMRFGVGGELKKPTYRLDDTYGHMIDFRPTKNSYNLAETIANATRKVDFGEKGGDADATDSYEFMFLVRRSDDDAPPPSFLLCNVGVGQEGGYGELGGKNFNLPESFEGVIQVPMYVEGEVEPQQIPYEVCDMVLHRGRDFQSGHYIAIGKRWNPKKRRVDWYKFDDDDVKILKDGPLAFIKSGRQTHTNIFVPLLLVLRLVNEQKQPEGTDNILFTSDRFGANDAENDDEDTDDDDDVEATKQPVEEQKRKKVSPSKRQQARRSVVLPPPTRSVTINNTNSFHNLLRTQDIHSATSFLFGNTLSQNPKFFNGYTFFKPNFLKLEPPRHNDDVPSGEGYYGDDIGAGDDYYQGPPAEDEGPPAEDEGRPAEDEGPPAEDEGRPAEDEGPPAVEAPPPLDKGAPAKGPPRRSGRTQKPNSVVAGRSQIIGNAVQQPKPRRSVRRNMKPVAEEEESDESDESEAQPLRQSVRERKPSARAQAAAEPEQHISKNAALRDQRQAKQAAEEAKLNEPTTTSTGRKSQRPRRFQFQFKMNFGTKLYSR